MTDGSTAHKADQKSLAIYLKEISEVNLLSPEEEIELAARTRKGDEAALERLISANLRFVVSIAKVYQNRGLSLTDLINEGNLGLLRAARRFDERKGIRFISYAVWWIRHSILKALAEQSKIVRLPLNKTERLRRIAKAAKELGQKRGRDPTVDEIARQLKVEASEVSDAMAIAKSDISLDAPVTEEDDCLVNIIEATTYPSPEELTKRNTFRDELERALDILTPREARILILYFGLGEENPHTLEEIGAQMRLSRERVRQIKEKALKKLRHSPESVRLRIYL
ncbi:RNA polymerase subunit sigma [candidate division TA06 bacterium DG_24]|uniref:RNA polymerase subunit sigma n=3 Tax=Bacteria division TA06 TaxID=1156500 RepID=A0A0S8JN26_UNCT6|nr:MAG: RNA polymerase subunit sigma [candidate division TA06 bacterium DG_24]KPK71610.1 MAG: RNA polymerase subunit sigma [candidate division TA06 bacterium SM23_40]KPL10189.1 MAG: RNA polymerase subunit sigma [candidate division TA06 bacterium SM1_40]